MSNPVLVPDNTLVTATPQEGRELAIKGLTALTSPEAKPHDPYMYRTRTCDPPVRSRVLLPTELTDHGCLRGKCPSYT